MPWEKDPHHGGVKIPELVQARTRRRIEAHATKNYKGKFTRLDIRFRAQYCYIDAYVEPNMTPGWPPPGHPETPQDMLERLRNTPTPLCRLHYFNDEDQWTLAFFTYSNEKYTPAMFQSGSFYGTPEEAFDIGAMYLND